MKRSYLKLSLLVLVPLFVYSEGYLLLKLNKKPETRTVASKEVKIMTYNLENLFDIINDPKKNDETYLPLNKKNKKNCYKAKKPHWIRECLNTNWTEFNLKEKMRRLSSVINSYKPDLLFVQEVENLKLLKRFNKDHLGFKHVFLIESPDKRGIDVGILTNLEKNLKKIPKLNLPTDKTLKKPSRGMLEVSLLLPNDEELTVFALHLPSQGSPTSFREQAITELNQIYKETPGLKIAAGDFNITKKEDRLYKENLSRWWLVSHQLGCKSCKGSYYYHPKRSWSFFDAILFSKNFNGKTWSVDNESIKVFNELELQNNKFGSPKKFYGGKEPTGISDHWPVVAKIYLP